MAGNRIDIEVEDRQVRAAVGRLVAALAQPRDAFEAIGSYLEASTIRRFEREEGPGGKSWKKSLRALAEGGQTLTDFGTLRGSIAHNADDAGVEVGSNLVYARIHQLGGKAGKGRKATLPARPYLGIDDRDALAIERIVERTLGKAAAA